MALLRVTGDHGEERGDGDVGKPVPLVEKGGQEAWAGQIRGR
jgi:hypothetical protein